MIKEADDTDLLPNTTAIHEFWNETPTLVKIMCAKDMVRKGKRNACKVLVGNPEVKRSLGSSRRNIKILEEEDVREWVELILMNTVTYSLVPKVRAISLIVQELLRPQEMICSVELVWNSFLMEIRYD